jgi:hypothetical protein
LSKKAARMNSMHSVRKMSHRREGCMKRSRHFLNRTNVGRLECDVMRCDLMWWVAWVAEVAGSIHINSIGVSFFPFFFSYFLILILILICSSFHHFICSSFLVHPIIFLSFYISYSHIHIFACFQKVQRAWTLCIPSGRCFREQKWYKAIQAFLSGTNVDRLGCDGVWSDGWQRWQRSRVRFRSTQLSFIFLFFLIFLFSYFLIFLFCYFVILLFPYFLILIFSCFPRSSYRISIFRIHIFAYFHIHIFASF